MRKINEIILHCSATEKGEEFDVSDIRRWHVHRGWSDVGYHYIILLDGAVQVGRPLERQGAHVKGRNRNSIGICYIGGLKDGKPFDTMNESQEKSFRILYDKLKDIFPEATLHGHNEFANKACPSFKVKDKFPDL